MTAEAKPGEWRSVEGRPFQVPFVDRLGAAIKEGDEVLFAQRSHLVRGRIHVLVSRDQTVVLHDIESPLTGRSIIRPTSEVVLANIGSEVPA
jgi:hypothetical protein